MPPVVRHLVPGLALIALASGILLWSDRRGARPADNNSGPAPKRLAILQNASNGVMDDTAQGLLDGLASRGYRDGGRVEIKKFIPQGDLVMAGQMSKQIVTGHYDLAATISTVCLQSLATADRDGQVPLVFCAVSDPVAAGVGVKELGSLDKPAYLTGYGTAQPVEDIFRDAVAANPKLKVVGVVWNPVEVNSEVCTKRARAICQELGLTLIEATIEGSKDVREAADSLVARGAEAFWTGGDATMLTAYDVLQQVADKARIPIFSNISGHAKRGALFDFGANYHQVGFQTGLLAADMLDGKPPSEIPVRNLMPGHLGLNEKTRAALKDPNWSFTSDQIQHAGYIVETNGDVKEQPEAEVATAGTAGVTDAAAVVAAKTSSTTAPPDTRPILPPPGGKLPWRFQIITYLETAPCEECLQGFHDGLAKYGLVEGRDYVARTRSASGDAPTLPALFDAAASDGTDLYLTFSTPTLQSAVKKVKKTPVVFNFVSDPVVAGAGNSSTDHLPNFTGISTLAPAAKMAQIIQTYFPKWKRVGTLYCPAEVNSVANLKYWRAAAAKAGLEVVEVAANTAGDLPDAAAALAGKDIDAIVQISDNLSAAGYPAINKAARSRHLPFFAFQSTAAEQGAMLAVSMDYHQAGMDGAALAARVVRGDNPGAIPFSLPSRQKFVLNLKTAADAGLNFPPELQALADEIIK